MIERAVHCIFPSPLQLGHLSGREPGSLPVPVHRGQLSMMLTCISLFTPRAACWKVRLTWYSFGPKSNSCCCWAAWPKFPNGLPPPRSPKIVLKSERKNKHLRKFKQHLLTTLLLFRILMHFVLGDWASTKIKFSSWTRIQALPKNGEGNAWSNFSTPNDSNLNCKFLTVPNHKKMQINIFR